MRKNHQGTVIKNIEIKKDIYELKIKSDMKEAFAGQFISVLCPNKTLRRPFSISNFNNGEITVLYKLKGEGTKYISSLRTGDVIDFLGALGNTFSYENTNSALLIGAGIGIAPMLFLKKEMNEKGIKNFLISGFKTNEEALLGSDKTVIGGSVMDNIDEIIEKTKPDTIYSCGPSIVLKLVCKKAEEKGLKAQVALEKVMACGIGVCRGCVIELKDGSNASVCKDGPVFEGEVIQWN